MANRQKARRLNTGSKEWRAIRATVLEHEPLCRECRKQGRVTAATHVDHIDGDAMNDDPSNHQPLCLSCHSSKTNAEDGGFGNAKGKYRPKGCGADGWPHHRE